MTPTLPEAATLYGYSLVNGRLYYSPESGGRFEMSLASLPMLQRLYGGMK